MTIAIMLLFLALGLLAGVLHVLAIARDADLLVRSGLAWEVVGIRLGRMALTALVLLTAARAGGAMLAAATTGWMIARWLILRRPGSTA